MKRISDPTSAFRARRISRPLGLLIARLFAILAFCAGVAQAGPYDTWGRYKTLTINTTGTGGGANVSATLTNYPLLVRLTTANADDVLSEALSNGADVRFSSSDGSTALSYQIERWSSTNAEIWVLVPSITGNSTTDIRIYWNKSGQSTASDGTAVFSTSNNFVAVYHLAEDGGTTSGAYKDATGNASNGTGTSLTNSSDVATVIGIGSDFDGTSQYISSTASTNSGTRTLSAWIYPNTSDDVSFIESVIDGDVGGQFGQGWGLDNGNIVAVLDNQFWYPGRAISLNTWQHVALTFNATTAKLYYNGDSVAALSYTQGSVTNTTYKIGKSNTNALYFDGGMDEVVIYEGSPSNSWIKMNYQSQMAGATCISFGPTVASTYYWHRNSVLTSSTDFSRAYNWTLNADGTGRRPASSPDDAFTGSYNGSWTCQDSDNNGGTGTCSAATKYGQLTLNGRGYDVFGDSNQFTALRRSDITGDFDVVVKVTSLTANSVNSKAALFMADNFASLGSGGYAGIGLRGDGKAEFLVDASGTVGAIETFTQSAVLITPSGGEVTGAIWLRLVKSGTSVSGYYRTSQSSAWTQVGSTATPQSTATNSQIALLHTSQNTSATGSAVFDEFQAGMPLSATDLDLSFAGTGSNADANATLSASQAAASIDFTGYTGTFNFSTYTLTLNTGDATFVSGMTVTAGSGTLAFTGNSGNQTFTPKSGATFPSVSKSGASGTVAVATSALTAGAFTLASGTWQWGSGLTHTVSSISTSAGSMDFGSSTVRVGTGSANLSSLASVTTGTGVLSFTGTSGTQVLTSPSGITLPAITHTAASTLQLSTNTLSCASFSQSAGVLDFNSVDISTTGDFTISSGTTSSLANLTSRTLTVGGDASLAGQSGNLLNLSAGAWTLIVTGTLTAQYANLAGSDASGGTEGTATLSRNGGNNSNWFFDVPVTSSNLTRSVWINFNTTSSGANVSGNVTNIPILVRFTSANLTFSATTDAGVDLLFVDKDGTALYHEVAEWDKANQTGKVWVKVPQVDGNSTGDYITAKYGCDSCTTNAYASSATVFSGFQSVFHLNAPEEKAYDATTLANHGAYGRNLPVAAGITGKGATFFDGTSTSFINVPNETNYDITSNLSVWAWIKVTSFSPAWQAIVTKGDDSWRLARNNSTNNLTFTCEKTAVDYATNGSVNVNDGAWHHVVGTYDGANVKLYVDGVQDGSNTALTGSVTNSANNVYIGENAEQTGRNWNGAISEVRIGNAAAALSADFIKLSYQNQKESSLLFSFFTAASFSKSKVFKFNTTASGANVSGDVTDFPLLVRFTDAAIVDATRSAGQDIRFLDRDGVTWLPYQIERWDQTNNVGEIWVKVPQVDGNSAGDYITMYYDEVTDNAVPDGQCATCVFATASGSTGTWHLNETGNTTADGYQDAGGNAAHAQGSNFSGGNEVTAMIARGQTFANASSRKITVKAGAESNFDITSAITVSAWINVSSWTVAWQAIATKGDGSWRLHRNNANGTLNFVCTGLSTNSSIAGSTTLTTGGTTWYHAVGVYDGSFLRMYLNGASDATALAATGSITTNNNNVMIGENEGATGRFFNGVIDEVRVENVARSANWIKLSYETQKASPTLFNAAPSDFVSTRKYTFNTTKTGSNVSADVTDFPLLVRITGSTIIDAVEGSGVTIPPDIRFLDADGTTWLNYVVERWSRNSDSADVWVQIPQVDGNSDHDYITLYYNSVTTAAVPDGQCATCVFPSASYSAVYHLNDSATSATVTEARGSYTGTFKQNGVGNHNTINHATEGMVGPGHSFNGTSDYVDIGTNSSIVQNVAKVTLQAWVKPSAFASLRDIVYLSNNTSTSSSRAKMEANASGYIEAGGRSADGDGTQVGTATTNAMSTGTWYHVAAILDYAADSVYLFRNGVQLPSSAVAWSQGTTANTVSLATTLGARADATTEFFSGIIDEVRISPVGLDTNAIKLSYETQRRSGNLFWNSRSGPNNRVTLTATATSSTNIALSWPSAVSDSSNADSVAIWVGYSAYPDSVGSSATLVTRLAKTDTTYSYPATYPTTYYFALAVRNTSGQWSPFTATSSDTATLSGVTRPDTIYVDVTTGLPANSCASAQNPATPKKTVKDALTCGASASDTLVVRVMPGTYTDSAFSVTASKPSIVTSFDNNSRAVFNGAGTATIDGGVRVWTLLLYGSMGIRNLDVKCLINGYSGVYVTAADNIYVEGCRIYNYSESVKHGAGIEVRGGSNQHHFANNLIYQPIYHGIRTTDDNSFNVVNNVIVGPGGSGTGFWMDNNAYAADMTLSNNIFYNWDYGLISNSANIGSCASNLFFGVTTGREVTTTTCTGSVIRDPLFANIIPTDRNAFKLLPGSPGIDAGSSTYGSGAQAVTRRTPTDYFGTSRPLGSAPDIGLYEGSGYTPNPSGEFDTLRVSSTSTTATVQNSKWKLVWDMARGAGITGFYDKTTDSTANLVYSNSLLFDAKIGSYAASSQTGLGPTLTRLEVTRALVVLRQNLPVSASIDLNIYYSIYPSGHVYIESELSNLSGGSTAVTTVDYTLRLGSTTAAYTSAGTNKGFGYLTTASRDAAITVTRDLDGGASGAETWSTSTAASGTPGTVVFNTTDMADLSQNTARRHNFLLYLGDNSLDFAKSAALNADAYGPSALTLTAGSIYGERSWQEGLQGHWNLDDGAGSTARDKSVFVQNNATVAGAGRKWVSGKVNGGLYLTATDSAYVGSASVLNPANGFTVMFWLKPDFSGMGDTALIVSKGLSNANGWYCRKVANASGTNKILFTMGAATVTSPTLTDLAWSHIAVVAKFAGNRNLEMYVNGVQVGASTAAATATSNSLNLLMGYASGAVSAAKFQGTLDDVRVYGGDISGSNIQSIFNRGFNSRYGQYVLRADNNNRVVALINADTAKTRIQPAFFISNWYGPRTPKYVYLNGTRLTPNVDFVCDSIYGNQSGNILALQLNKILTGANQTLFIDDDDSTGFMGSSSAMKSLTISSTASDKIMVKNFSDTVFGGAASGQWYMELDLNGWATPTRTTLSDTGFGEINVWKAAAVSPNVAISTAYQMVGWGPKTGRSLSYMKLDATGSNEIFTGGAGSTTAGITYTLADSSSTRLSLTLSGINLSQGGTVASVTKRFTFYPTGRVFVSYSVTGATIDMDTPRLDLNTRYDGGNPVAALSNTMARDSARQALYGGSLNFHSIGLALLSVKNNASNYTTGATMLSGVGPSTQLGASNDQIMEQFTMPTSIWTGANKPVTVNFMMDFSKDFGDAATADSLLKDAQRPAVLTAITGTRITNDALDFNADNFAEGDGAYTFAASSGIAHFKYANPVTSFNPAFRISTWTQGVLPEFVVVDNQVLVRGYHYNAYLNTASNEVILQLNKTLAPGTHVIFISHKSGLAVTLRTFTATGGEGVDSLAWSTESEFENLGFHVWRRLAPGEAQSDSNLTLTEMSGGTAKQSAAKPATGNAGDSGNVADTLPSLHLSAEELAALGYVRITPRILPGAKGGSSASTQDYLFLDRTAVFGTAYEYLLEAVDFNGNKVQYGPRLARPLNPLNTELYSNYPNPFNPITTLRFSLKEKLKVSLVIYDAKGKLVRTLVRNDKAMLPGKYRLVWDAKNERGFEAPSGQYFYRFTAGRYVKTRKMILVK